MKRPSLPLPLLALFGLALAAPALAEPRNFAYSLQSASLAPGAAQLQLWSSPRVGRADYFVRVENRVELQWGLTKRLSTSGTLNSAMEQAGSAQRESLEVSASNRWKLALLDQASSPVGLALCAEANVSAVRLEVEARLVADAQLDALALVFNATFSQGWRTQAEERVREVTLEQTAGAAYRLTSALAVGMEARNRMVVAPDGLRAGIYLGPSVTYSHGRFFGAFGFTPQVASVKPSFVADRKERVELVQNERFTGRLLLGLDL